jgi:hypothetical protein
MGPVKKRYSELEWHHRGAERRPYSERQLFILFSEVHLKASELVQGQLILV